MISEWMKVMLEEISRKKAEEEQWRIEEQRRQLRQLHGRCVECGGPIELVVGAGFVMTTGCSVCQVCHRRPDRQVP